MRRDPTQSRSKRSQGPAGRHQSPYQIDLRQYVKTKKALLKHQKRFYYANDQLSVFLSSARHLSQMILPLKREALSILPQNIQAGSYFLRTIVSSLTKISTASRLARERFFRISMGKTILPSSSILLTIPVDFMIYNPPKKFPVLSFFYSITQDANFVNICKRFFSKKKKNRRASCRCVSVFVRWFNADRVCHPRRGAR